MFARLRSFLYALIRGYLDEKRVRGDAAKARIWAREAVAGSRAIDSLQIQYWAGIQNWDGGETFAVLDGGGAASVRNTDDQEIVSFQSNISSDDFRALLQSMLDEDWFGRRPLARPAPPDDTMVQISLIDTDNILKFYIKEWNSAVCGDAVLELVTSKIRAHIDRISGGQISF